VTVSRVPQHLPGLGGERTRLRVMVAEVASRRR